MKKETLILLSLAAAAGFYFYTRSKKRSGIITVDNPEIITERQFESKERSLDVSPLEKITKVVQTIFPKKTAEQKAAKKLKRQTKKAARKKVAGFSDNVFY